ncbi:hypothetical protein [Lachnoclostridium sp.]|nr:hypothetical protein [Lachnoclostridium sp.]
MWISRKKFKQLEKKVADLEKKVQSQQQTIAIKLDGKEIAKSLATHRRAL